MTEDDKTKAFIIDYVGLQHMAPYEQEEVLGYIWNAIHNRIFDSLSDHLDKPELDSLSEKFMQDESSALLEVKERIPGFDKIAKESARQVIEEFKKIRETQVSK